MPEQILLNFDVRAEGTKEGRVRVPECVPSDPLFDAQLLGYRTNSLAHYALSPEWPLPIGPRACEHPIIRTSIASFIFPFLEDLGWGRPHRDRLHRRLRLAIADDTMHDRSHDAFLFTVEVHVPPAQTKQLALTKPRSCVHKNQDDESRPIKPWLFRIAHNRSIDFLRRNGVRDEAESAVAMTEVVSPAEPAILGIGKAVEHLVASLPPKERACILLKDVFDYTLEEIAELVDSTVGGVKAALNGGRTKLASSPASSPSVQRADPELAQIMQLYVDRFNRRDWEGVRELISADARLNVLDRFAGKFADALYLFNYDRWPWPWKLALGEVGGEPVLIVLQRGADTWTSCSVIRVKVRGQEIEQIVDYIHRPWVIPAARSISLLGSRECAIRPGFFPTHD